ncbi:MAG: hypothetical protein NC822_01915 [Candidatus Omnitrophica bacterium]|nr:hypothetical protein [Candidatus Omnitrophota bacterium]
MIKRFRSDVGKDLFRVPISIDKITDTWLYTLSMEMKLNGGYKLPKSFILRGLINAFLKLNIDYRNIKSIEDLEERILTAINS